MLIRNRNEVGFTLIELMIVAVIIGVLATLGGGAYLTSVKRGRDTERISELKAIAAAQEQFYSRFPGGGTYDHSFVGTPCDEGALASYFSNGSMPESPGDSVNQYECEIADDDSSFCARALLELGGGNCGGCSCPGNDCAMDADAATHFCVLGQQ